MVIGLKISDHPIRTYKNKTAIDIFKEGIKLGFRFFELSAQQIKDLRFFKQNLNRGIEFGIHTPHAWSETSKINLCATVIDEKKKARKWFQKSTQLAEKLKAKYLIVHPDPPKALGKTYALSKKEAWKSLVDNLKSYSSYVPLLTENMPSKDYLVYDTETCFRLKKEIPNIGFAFDTDHAYQAMSNMEEMIDFYNQIKNNVIVIHLSDFDGKEGHLPLGEGKIDFQEFFKKCKITKEQFLILEVIPKAIKDLKIMREEIEQYLRK